MCLVRVNDRDARETIAVKLSPPQGKNPSIPPIKIDRIQALQEWAMIGQFLPSGEKEAIKFSTSRTGFP